MADNSEPFNDWLNSHLYTEDSQKMDATDLELGKWTEIRLFLSSTFVDTHAERDTIIKNVIPEINRKMAPSFIRIIPVDLRWGVLAEESKSCYDIQKTCLNQVDKCRIEAKQTPWFLALRTNRYGWVQGEMMPSEGFEKPDFFHWLDELKAANKAVSITTLEVCHATRTPEEMTPYPTVFCYRRKFTVQAKKDIATEELRWVFDFEYTDEEITDPQLKFQYSFNKQSSAYEADRNNLDKYLQNKPHVLFSDYKASFGSARYTCKRENAKSFGVGYTSGLQEFTEKVEQDLLTAIRLNFCSPSNDDIDEHAFATIQHGNAVRQKAANFVGREVMLREAINHLEVNNDSPSQNTLILHGEPGCGKSGLLAAVAVQAMKMQDDGNFVYVHAVDSCPGSSILEKFLRRLHVNLRAFRRKKGENNVHPIPPEAVAELKKHHHSFLVETAQKYPQCQIIIIVDAVNQFHDSMRAWDMWWLMQKYHECPKNVRFVLSTLNKENETFQNAKDSCGGTAKTLEVTHMCREDLVEMVEQTLKRYNKKLTTYDDGLLGNQMDLLLSKSSSPLFLIAAAEALRKFGIFEQVSEYIRSLPTSITELFSFLIDGWVEEYGKMFTEDVLGLISLSKDGLLENEISDLLSFKEEKVNGKNGDFLYDSSFSRIYDSLSSFLAAGGGGYLRFFHDQLKYTVRDKFLDDTFSRQTQEWMRDFFLSIISPQLCESPKEKTPDYYEHALQQVVYHQLKAAKAGDGSLDCLKDTLRNIYFIKERIVHGQEHSINEDYLSAIEQAVDSIDVVTLKLWAKFAQLYAECIKEFPDFAYNMASTQAPAGAVCKDTLKLPAPTKRDGYPWSWVNIPEADDPMAIKIPVGGVDCAASCPKNDVIVVATKNFAGIYDQSSGEMLHQLNVSAFSVLLSQDEKSVFVGDAGGYVYCYDIYTGALKFESSDTVNDTVTWLGFSGTGLLIAGSGYARSRRLLSDHTEADEIMTLHESSLESCGHWSSTYPAWHYCYNTKAEILFSSHKGFIVGWDLTGEKLMQEQDGSKYIYCIDTHPTEKRLISGNNNLRVVEWEIGSDGLQVGHN